MADWSNVTSAGAAQLCAARGELDRTLLIPGELGGQDLPENVTYLPYDAIKARDAAIAELIAAIRDGRADQIAVTPEYRGESYVPAALLISGWREGGAPAFERRIAVW